LVLLFNFDVVCALGRSRKIRRDCNWMGHIAVLLMLTDCART
jgi:hypothetical protein